MKNKTFISYSTKDLDVVERIVEKLEMEGLTCWYAKRNIPLGSNYDELITHAIESSQAFVVIVSKDSDKSEHVKNEINLALDQAITIYPLRIQNFKANGLIYFIGRKNWVDAWAPPIEGHLKRLASQINAAKNIIKPILPINSEDTDCLDKPNEKTHSSARYKHPWRRWFLPLGLVLMAILLLGGIFLIKCDRAPRYTTVQVADHSMDFRTENSGALVLLPSDERNVHLTLTLPTGRYVLEILTNANGEGGVRLENAKSGTNVTLEGAVPHPEIDEFSVLYSGNYLLSPNLENEIRIVFFKPPSSPVRLGWVKQQK